MNKITTGAPIVLSTETPVSNINASNWKALKISHVLMSVSTANLYHRDVHIAELQKRTDCFSLHDSIELIKGSLDNYAKRYKLDETSTLELRVTTEYSIRPLVEVENEATKKARKYTTIPKGLYVQNLDGHLCELPIKYPLASLTVWSSLLSQEENEAAIETAMTSVTEKIVKESLEDGTSEYLHHFMLNKVPKIDFNIAYSDLIEIFSQDDDYIGDVVTKLPMRLKNTMCIREMDDYTLRIRAKATELHGLQKYGSYGYIYHLDDVLIVMTILMEGHPSKKLIFSSVMHDAIEDVEGLDPYEVFFAGGLGDKSDIQTLQGLTNPTGQCKYEVEKKMIRKLCKLSIGLDYEYRTLITKISDRISNVTRCALNPTKESTIQKYLGSEGELIKVCEDHLVKAQKNDLLSPLQLRALEKGIRLLKDAFLALKLATSKI